ncbi:MULTISPECIES: LysR family transcriptional regulator [Deefgea]|uniref:LysR family transcriptional regulator n=1 Tax=Deefgea chitinilytica TaxID=570276 RepID=A0ABS2CD46_9NEIS|nr:MULTISPECIES: LysR family transcriptional regulator [Deefgea]MBM5572069.1 LysR family transcriptional regulator [Deefgea chitinilytica]MBM9889304.1 LysR family transcriptional regulator [Deefgea sp. CFH1-16]
MNDSTLNYRHLYYFWIVTREGSISAAARKLEMTPQTISSQLAKLEEQAGKSLFKQVGRQLELTDAGRAILPFADQIFMLGEQMQQLLASDATPRQRFNVGVADALPKTVAQQLLASTHSAQSRLMCIEGSPDELMAKLALHQLDLVLADRPAAHGSHLRLESHALAQCPVMILGHATLTAQYLADFPASLHGAPMLLPTRNTALRIQLDLWFAERNIAPDVVGEFADSALMKAFAISGIGLYPSPMMANRQILPSELQSLGHLAGLYADYYAIYAPKKINHPMLDLLLGSVADQSA